MSGIVVGVDGSQHAQYALEWAMREAAVRKAPLTVVTVHQVAVDNWGLSELHYPGDESARQRALEAAEQSVDKISTQLGDLKPQAVKVKAINGIPAEVLISESKDADLIVVGTRGGFEKYMLGSVSTKVAHRSKCPVVIVPDGKGD